MEKNFTSISADDPPPYSEVVTEDFVAPGPSTSIPEVNAKDGVSPVVQQNPDHKQTPNVHRKCCVHKSLSDGHKASDAHETPDGHKGFDPRKEFDVHKISDRHKIADTHKTAGSNTPKISATRVGIQKERIRYPVPHRQGPSVVIVRPPIAVPENLGRETGRMDCPYCGARISTRVVYREGYWTHLAACLCCFCCGLICALIPYCIDDCKDAHHECPNCNREIGVSKC